MRVRPTGGADAGRLRRLTRLSSMYLAVVLALEAMGCGEGAGPGDINVSKEGRARIVSDADADGNVTLPKSKNPRRPAAGLKTFRALKDAGGRD